MVNNVLLVRARQELTKEFEDKLTANFGECNFIDVEPRTPQHLLDLVREHNAIAVVLRENPLPALAMRVVPCIPLRPGEPLQRLTDVSLTTEPL